VQPVWDKEIARMRTERHLPHRYQSDDVWQKDLTASGLVGAGLHAVSRWLSEQ
jgi:hypothetical protein